MRENAHVLFLFSHLYELCARLLPQVYLLSVVKDIEDDFVNANVARCFAPTVAPPPGTLFSEEFKRGRKYQIGSLMSMCKEIFRLPVTPCQRRRNLGCILQIYSLALTDLYPEMLCEGILSRNHNVP